MPHAGARSVALGAGMRTRHGLGRDHVGFEIAARPLIGVER
jgi:hypothetical protein